MKMSGSEKQIKWAEQIKTELLAEASRLEYDQAEVVAIINAVPEASIMIEGRGSLKNFWLKAMVADSNRAKIRAAAPEAYAAAKNISFSDFVFQS